MVTSSPSLIHFAERLASALGGGLAHETTQLSCRRLIRIIDTTVPRPTPHLQATQVLNIVIGVPLNLISVLIPSSEAIVYLDDDHPGQLWRSIKVTAENPKSWEPRAPFLANPKGRPRVFLSHAIGDESLLMEPIARLRSQYQLEIFVCADSLHIGGIWRQEIEEALSNSTLVIVAISESMKSSTFCAYEVGFAHGKGIQTLALSLDGTPPPQYLAHQQCIDLSRRSTLSPWLSRSELLLLLFIELISQATPEQGA